MKAVICLKQVPDTTDIKWTKENNIVREGLLSILNPLDDYALECGLKLKQNVQDTFITALTMGPVQAKSILEYALARCADNAILLNDKKFAGSDTLATARVLSSAIKNSIKDFDLIMCAQSAADGETAQTPPSLAQLLDIEYVPNVKNIIRIFENNEKILLEQKTDYGLVLIEVKTPVVISVLENEDEIVKPKIEDFISAQEKLTQILGLKEILINENDCGIAGSPTYVHKVYRPIVNRKCSEIDADFADFIINSIDEVVLNKPSGEV